MWYVIEGGKLDTNKEQEGMQKSVIEKDGVEIVFKILEAIKRVLKEDSEQKMPMCMKIKDSFVYNIIKEIVKNKKRSLIISITGESASGKTTFVQNSIKAYPSSLNGGIYTTINCDDYYLDMSKELEQCGSYEALFAAGYSFDTPDAINLELMKQHLLDLKEGKDVRSPLYNFVTCESKPEGEVKKPALLILNEGLYVLNENVRDVADVKVYIYTPFEVIKERWYKRAITRGKTGKAADMQFENVNLTAQTYIRPTLEFADIVLNGQVSPEYIAEFINKMFDEIKKALQ